MGMQLILTRPLACIPPSDDRFPCVDSLTQNSYSIQKTPRHWSLMMLKGSAYLPTVGSDLWLLVELYRHVPGDSPATKT